MKNLIPDWIGNGPTPAAARLHVALETVAWIAQAPTSRYDFPGGGAVVYFLFSYQQGVSDDHDFARYDSSPTAWWSMTERFSELAGLWARRDQLDDAEWSRLYELVMEVLTASPPSEEKGAVLSREGARAWRDSFFVDKVLMPATRGNAAMSRELTRGGLGVFYRNYLRDQLRKVDRRREIQGFEGAEDTLKDEASADAQEAGDTFRGESCHLRSDKFGDDGLQASARDFVADADDWVVIYLALHFCGGRDRLPLSKIHQQFQIPSYHYKARSLGIAPPRGGFEAYSEFSETMIGQWLTQNAIEIDPENTDSILSAFDRLCVAAFHEARSRKLADIGGPEK